MNKLMYRFTTSPGSEDGTSVYSLDEPKDEKDKFYFYLELSENLKTQMDAESFNLLKSYESKLLSLAERLEFDITYFVNKLTGKKCLKAIHFPKGKKVIAYIRVKILTKESFEFRKMSVHDYSEYLRSIPEELLLKWTDEVEVKYYSDTDPYLKPTVLNYKGMDCLGKLNRQLVHLLSQDIDTL